MLLSQPSYPADVHQAPKAKANTTTILSNTTGPLRSTKENMRNVSCPPLFVVGQADRSYRCRKRDSNYTCPRCNVAYCSLSCFQDQSHVQCSEPFYKSTVLSEIATDPKVDNEEKRKMIEMLKRFEDAQIEGEDGLEELKRREEEEDDELATALKDVDLDTIESNDLLRLLPPEHRDAFIAALRNPDSDAAKRLLDAAVADDDDRPELLPWWERQALQEGDETLADENYEPVPSFVDEGLVAAISPPAGAGLKLAYNVLAICLAYFHILLSYRLPSLNTPSLKSANLQSEEIKPLLSALAPFFTDPKSTVRYESVREAWTAIWDAIGGSTDAPPSTDNLVRLLETLVAVVHPPLLADEATRVSLLLSDLYRLVAVPKPTAPAPKKMLFYVAALRQLDRADWLRIKNEVSSEVAKLTGELGDSGPEDTTDDRPALKIA